MHGGSLVESLATYGAKLPLVVRRFRPAMCHRVLKQHSSATLIPSPYIPTIQQIVPQECQPPSIPIVAQMPVTINTNNITDSATLMPFTIYINNTTDSIALPVDNTTLLTVLH